MKLAINLANVPDKVPLIDAGEYDFSIDSIELKAAEDNFKERYEFVLSVIDGPMKGRKVFESFPLEFLAQETNAMTVKFRHLVLSAGLPGDLREVDTDDLKGKTVRGFVSHRNYKDRSGEMKTSAGIKDYVYKQ